MNSGKELDALVGELFLGWVKVNKPHSGHTHQNKNGNWCSLPEFSTDRNCVWDLLDELADRGWIFSYSTMKDGKNGNFVSIGYLNNPFDPFHQWIESTGETIQHALCDGIIKVCQIKD